MMKCIAIDDEPLALELLANFAGRATQCELVRTFTDPVKARSFLEQHTDIDLLFMDIQMPDIMGTELYNGLVVKPMVIFTTAFSEHAVEGFTLDAIDYLLKPFDYERFEKGILKAYEYRDFQQKKNKQVADAIFVRSDYKLVKILFDDISYIESVDDYVKIHRVSDKPVMTLMSMKSILSKLPGAAFIRIHRRYIISVKRISNISAKKVMLDSAELPIGERFAEQVRLLA